jgi:hypothetical protein
MKRIAESLRAAITLGLYDRDDIVSWAASVAAREAKPPRAIRTILELSTAGRLEANDLAELLRAVPGAVAPGEVERVVVGVVARAVAAGGLDPRSAARVLYTLCIDAPGELRQLADLEDDCCMAENGTGPSLEEVSAAIRERLRAFEHLAAEMPPPRRAVATG